MPDLFPFTAHMIRAQKHKSKAVTLQRFFLLSLSPQSCLFHRPARDRGATWRRPPFWGSLALYQLYNEFIKIIRLVTLVLGIIQRQGTR